MSLTCDERSFGRGKDRSFRRPARCMNLINEMERNSAATMAGAGFGDIQAEIWDLFHAERRRKPDLFMKFLLSAVLSGEPPIHPERSAEARDIQDSDHAQHPPFNMDEADLRELDQIMEMLGRTFGVRRQLESGSANLPWLASEDRCVKLITCRKSQPNSARAAPNCRRMPASATSVASHSSRKCACCRARDCRNGQRRLSSAGGFGSGASSFHNPVQCARRFCGQRCGTPQFHTLCHLGCAVCSSRRVLRGLPVPAPHRAMLSVRMAANGLDHRVFTFLIITVLTTISASPPAVREGLGNPSRTTAFHADGMEAEEAPADAETPAASPRDLLTWCSFL